MIRDLKKISLFRRVIVGNFLIWVIHKFLIYIYLLKINLSVFFSIIYIIELQKRGPPHAYILLFIHLEDKYLIA